MLLLQKGAENNKNGIEDLKKGEKWITVLEKANEKNKRGIENRTFLTKKQTDNILFQLTKIIYAIIAKLN